MVAKKGGNRWNQWYGHCVTANSDASDVLLLTADGDGSLEKNTEHDMYKHIVKFIRFLFWSCDSFIFAEIFAEITATMNDITRGGCDDASFYGKKSTAKVVKTKEDAQCVVEYSARRRAGEEEYKTWTKFIFWII